MVYRDSNCRIHDLYYERDTGMSIKTSKKQTFEQIAQNFWEKLVRGILVPGERGYAPSMGEILCAYNEMRSRQPECEYIVLRTEKGSDEYFQPGDKFGGIRIIRKFDDASSSIEFILTNSTYYVRFETQGIDYLSHTVNYCDLSPTVRNFEDFIEKFPKYMESLEKKRLDYEKKNKIKEMTDSSIRASVSQVMSASGRRWSLDKFGKGFMLRIMANDTQIELTLNSRNFAKRISALTEVMEQVDAFSRALPFPVDVSIKK